MADVAVKKRKWDDDPGAEASDSAPKAVKVEETATTEVKTEDANGVAASTPSNTADAAMQAAARIAAQVDSDCLLPLLETLANINNRILTCNTC
jgi:hypothetical protein